MKLTKDARDSRKLSPTQEEAQDLKKTSLKEQRDSSKIQQSSVGKEFPQHAAFLQAATHLQSLVPKIGRSSKTIVGQTPFIYIDL